MFDTDREVRDRLVDDLKAKIRNDKALFQRRLETQPEPLAQEQSAGRKRSSRLREVFQAMGF